MNPSSAFSSFAAYAFNNTTANSSSGHSNNNNNSLNFNNKNIYASSVTQFLNQSIYEPIEDDDNYSHISTFPSPGSIASAFNYDYYQSQTSMDPETCNSFESLMSSQQEKNVAKNLADVAEAHEQSLKLFRESFDLTSGGGGGGVGNVRQPLDINDAKKKHKKSKRDNNQ